MLRLRVLARKSQCWDIWGQVLRAHTCAHHVLACSLGGAVSYMDVPVALRAVTEAPGDKDGGQVCFHTKVGLTCLPD